MVLIHITLTTWFDEDHVVSSVTCFLTYPPVDVVLFVNVQKIAHVERDGSSGHGRIVFVAGAVVPIKVARIFVQSLLD